MSGELNVHYWFEYFTRWGGRPPTDFNGSTWAAKKMVDALKGDSINKYAYIPTVGGRTRKLTDRNRHKAPEWFGEWAAARIREAYDITSHPPILVPVPNHHVVSGFDEIYPGFELAQCIADHLVPADVQVLDALRFKSNVGKTRTGSASRSRRAIRRNLFLLDGAWEWINGFAIWESPPDCILVDDIMASGAHLQACESLLAEAGFDVVMAVVAGRVVHEPSENAFEGGTERMRLLRPRTR